ncbi:hypothetical protein LJC32_03475 [Oscillospiraceae bacterium OttesenSCG-928-F05]|nr:hypothetical protein [Oscillospiraceae bacterium OttesenSCG-928-F05]
MSLRRIDTQIMINRTLDASSEQSYLQKHGEVAQTQFAAHFKAQTERDMNRPQAAKESSEAKMRANEDGRGNAGYGGGKKKKKDGKKDQPEGPLEHIDIRT